MNIQLDRRQLETLIEVFPSRQPLLERLRYGTFVELPLRQLDTAEVRLLAEREQRGDARQRARAAQMLTVHEAMCAEGQRLGSGDLEQLLPALVRHLACASQRGWLFSAQLDGRPLAYVVTRVDFVPSSNDESAKVLVELKANAKAALLTHSLRITASDIGGRTVAEILAARGYVRETAALLAAHDEMEARYLDWRSRHGAQFSARGTGYYAEDPNASHRDTDWSRKNLVILSSSGGEARLVNDEGILKQQVPVLEASGDIFGSYLGKAAKSNRYDAEDEVRALRAELPAGLFTRVPVHPFVLMFHLELHHHVWVHVEDLQRYRYRPELKHKLVLPPEQTDLIDILTAEMDVLMDDIVAGKSGGTTVLCAGPPGVGKTLTAEVYSEIIQRPLYRVHSGQLGLNVAAMETALKEVLVRAQRWGAVMLIDEADVYIKRRDDDMTMNAVVGVFLRVLEYFNGLLFLTTNRIDDIDEAIVSRCIALIRYTPPDRDGRVRIWQVMLAQFGLEAALPLAATLADLFPSASGRDIKGLAKLVAKYCQHKAEPPALDAFRRCSIFRGLDLAELETAA